MTELEKMSIQIMTDYLAKPPIVKEFNNIMENLSYGYDTDVSELLHDLFSYVYESLYQESILSFFQKKNETTYRQLLRYFIINHRNQIIATYQQIKSYGYDTNYGTPNFGKSWTEEEILQTLTDVTHFHAEKLLINELLSFSDTSGLSLSKPLSKAKLPYSFENGSNVTIKNKKGVEKFLTALQSIKTKASQ